MIAVLAAIVFMTAQAAPPGAVLEGHERRGGAIERLDGAAAISSAACGTVCARRPDCQAWTWRTGWAGREARCELHGFAATPSPHPGAVTGLSPALAARIDAASERAPGAREISALEAAAGGAPAATPQTRAGARRLAGG